MRKLRFVMTHVLLCAATAFVFFQSVKSLIVLIPIFGIRMYRGRHELREQYRRQLEEHFRDGLQCLLASLEAGYSIENSIAHAASDLRMMFEEKEPIVKEFRRMEYRIAGGASAEAVLTEFGERSGVADIRNFAGIFVIAKRTGGDVVKVIRSATDTLYQKQEVMREIHTILLSKQFEVGIMKAMPYLMILYFLLFSPAFLAPMYTGTLGPIIMFFLYLLYRAFCLIAERIARIDI